MSYLVNSETYRSTYTDQSMPDQPRKMPKQYAPVKFGEPFNPNSVEGHHRKQRQAAAIRYRKEREGEEAQWDALRETEEARLANQSWFQKLWGRFSG